VTDERKAISTFWSQFLKRSSDLACVGSADSAAYEALLELLQQVDPGLYLELSVDPAECELIVSADGDRELFPLARRVVAAAPAVAGWAIRALKPKLGFPETTRWEDLIVRIDSIVFDPVDLDGDELGLRIFVPGIAESDIDDAHNAVLRALDHGLGEEGFAEAVQSTEVYRLPPDSNPDDHIPLLELEKFIEWRDSAR
jgi:hypothetical protein